MKALSTMIRWSLLILGLVLLCLYSLSVYVFFKESGRVPDSTGELINWIMGWPDAK